MTQLVVLEDAPERLSLFKAELARVQIRITDDVTEFIQLVQDSLADGSLQMVIMDHDLGRAKGDGRRLDFDKNGLSGTEAADMLPPLTVPVLIWSANSVGALRMAQTLQDKGCNVYRVPIYQPEIIATVLKMYLGA